MPHSTRIGNDHIFSKKVTCRKHIRVVAFMGKEWRMGIKRSKEPGDLGCQQIFRLCFSFLLINCLDPSKSHPRNHLKVSFFVSKSRTGLCSGNDGPSQRGPPAAL